MVQPQRHVFPGVKRYFDLKLQPVFGLIFCILRRKCIVEQAIKGVEQMDDMLSTSVFSADSKSELVAVQQLLSDERFSVKHDAFMKVILLS